MADPELTRIVEAILFAADAPVSLDRMTGIVSGYGRTDIRDAVTELNRLYAEGGHAFEVNEVGGGWQLYCRADYAKWIRELHRGRIPTRLSQAALETLAIIAYKQPIVRPEIEAIRGVDSSGVLATLLKRNLVTIVGRAPGLGRALMYGTTKEFLRYFGLNSVTDLPRLEEFAEVLGIKPEELALAVEGAEVMAGAAEARDDETDDDAPEEDDAVAEAADAATDETTDDAPEEDDAVAEAADAATDETTDDAPEEDDAVDETADDVHDETTDDAPEEDDATDETRADHRGTLDAEIVTAFDET